MPFSTPNNLIKIGPNYAEMFMDWLRNNSDHSDHFGDGAVVFARLDDPERRKGRRITNSLFAPPNSLENVSEIFFYCCFLG